MDGLPSVERFYRRLLELDTAPDLDACIADALCVLTEITGARFGIVELFDCNPLEDAARWRFRAPRPEPDGFICHDIVRAAVEDRATINIASGRLHPRFRESATATSDAVLCAPIGAALPVGVIYLQGRAAPGRFLDVDRERAELLARHVACEPGRLFAGRAPTLDDELHWFAQRAARGCLERHRGNVSRAARELGITRARIYRILGVSVTAARS